MLRNVSGTLIPVQSESEDFMGLGIHGPKSIGPGPRTEKIEKSRTGPDQDLKGLRKPSISEKARTNSDQDQIFSENLGPNHTRDKKFSKILDRTIPGPTNFEESWWFEDPCVEPYLYPGASQA